VDKTKIRNQLMVANLLFILNVLLLFFYFTTFEFLLRNLYFYTCLLLNFYFSTFLSVVSCKSFFSGLQMFLSFVDFYVSAPETYVSARETCVSRPETYVSRPETTFITQQRNISNSIPSNRYAGVRKKVLKTQIETSSL